eukprot:7332_1
MKYFSARIADVCLLCLLDQVGSMSILHFCKAEQFDKAKQLLNHSKYDAKLLNEQDHSGRCALHYVVLSNQQSMCELLLKSGASSNIQDGQGNTPLHLSLSQLQNNGKNKRNACTLILCDGTLSAYDWRLQDAFGRTALHWICAHGFDTLLKDITRPQETQTADETEEKKSNDNNQSITNKYSIFSAFNLQNKSGQTCMHWAVDKQKWKCVYLLLEIAENGLLDLTIKDTDGLLAYDLCQEELAKQQIWDQTNVQLQKKEKEKKANSVQKFAVNTVVAKNKNKNGVSISKKKKMLKLKGKGKRKMKIKLKK